MWNVPVKTIYTITTKINKNRIFVQCAFTDKDRAEDSLCDLKTDKPEYYHYIEKVDLYVFDE